MYTALVLDQESHNRLVELFDEKCAGWKRYCHHMTINLGSANQGPAKDMVGQKATCTAIAYGVDNLVCAVKVESDVPSNNAIKHVTVAVNEAGGGKPKHSNNLQKWIPLDSPISLTGTIQVVE